MGSVNTEQFIAYCRKCKARRRFTSYKGRTSADGFSYGFPTRYICSKNHIYTTRPPRNPPRKRS